MQQQKALLVIGILVATALIPAVLLFILFSNTADVQWADGGIKLGGPVAAFFAILLLLMSYYSRLRSIQPREADLAAPFKGAWHVIACSEASDRTLTSDFEADISPEGYLVFKGPLCTEEKKQAGEWQSQETFCTPNSIGFRYTLTDYEASHPFWVGFASLHVEARATNGRPDKLVGRWDVFGKEHHSGVLTFIRPDQRV